jgi:methylated-DNA-[protein]-cysteine S-methyltransferase
MEDAGMNKREMTQGTVGNSLNLATPLGPIRLVWAAGALTEVDLEPDSAVGADAGPVPQGVAAEVAAYFADPGHHFEVPLGLSGTPFQRRVWDALRAIPPGRTRTYGDLAAELGTSPRAIGAACRANPCPIVVPCHRVVGATGLGGFAGDVSGHKVAVKRWLLRHEGVEIPG